MTRTLRKSKGRTETGTFLPVPTDVLKSHNFLSLSTKAKALILDLGARFTGYNNGDLAAPWSWMQARGWRSKDTLHKAIKELVQAGMIEQTRQGGLHGPSLYAFTWRPIDECKAHPDISPTRVASGKWRHSIEVIPVKTETQLPPRSLGKSAPVIGQDHAMRVAK
ncbi:hypothetical protein FHW84_003783 [Dyella sp. SG562]|jgi:hypothetical protein|uniref:hypothetical protein n=1 Tax=Dyella sp. SG562 TaxID=2587017 RepID=UPI001ABA24C7|nr:hypothetical protein [Dyella sp. SG562]NII75185.1 hypothetical protein [Dyella sp. SG562]